MEFRDNKAFLNDGEVLATGYPREIPLDTLSLNFLRHVIANTDYTIERLQSDCDVLDTYAIQLSFQLEQRQAERRKILGTLTTELTVAEFVSGIDTEVIQ